MTTPSIPENALILLEEPAGGWRWLLEKQLAGVTPLKRLVFSMGRAGIKQVRLVCRGLEAEARDRLATEFNNDVRCRAAIDVLDAGQAVQGEGVPEAGDGGVVLVAPGHLVTTPATVKAFLQTESAVDGGDGPGSFDAGLRLIQTLDVNQVMADFQRGAEIFSAPSSSTLPPRCFLEFVNSAESFRRVEHRLLDHYRHHYTQLLDVYFNAHFSIPISSLLVKLPVTPNQVTLMGLGIGALAGWFFSRGDYLSGVLGGILLAFTAVWDCCDGDVARLKFMESDFGETLDTACDNIINIFLFVGIAAGVAQNHGWSYALAPFVLLALGGFSIFALIYFPGGGKGDFFKGTPVYDVILLLASRNFIYVILGFALAGNLEWFLWLAGFGSLAFALFLLVAWKRIQWRTQAGHSG